MNLNDADNIISIIIAILAVGGFFVKKYSDNVKESIAKDKLVSIQSSFNSIVIKLSSPNMSEKISSAILLRRFFDNNSEFSIKNQTPFASSAIDVIAGLLRYEKTSDFQKILGDSIKYCKTIKKIDLQRTNLQNVYFSHDSEIDITGSDFFGADLSNASLRNIIAKECQFYEARLCNTVFKGADLQNSNFMYADLDGCNFKEAKLTGANFQFAINIPKEIEKHLDDQGIFRDDAPSSVTCEKKKLKSIFIATPGILSNNQKIILDHCVTKLKSLDIDTRILDRKKYQPFGITAGIKKAIQASKGIIVFGFCNIEIKEGTYRDNTEERKELKNVSIISPWIHTEIGIAIGSSKPILLILENDNEINEGAFEEGLAENSIEKLIFNAMEIDKDLSQWCKKV
jgi:hypothetical protein